MTQTTNTAQLSALLDQGLGHIAAGRREEAGQCFENVIKAGAGAGSLNQRDKPLIAQAHNQLGIKAMAGGMFHEAFGHFEAARDIAGFDPSLELNRGLALMNLGRLEEAEGAFSGVLEKNPGDPQAAFHLGKIYLKQGRAEKAVPCLEQAAKAAPSRVEIYLELGMSLELSGKKPEAAKQFEKVRGMSPDLYQHYYKKAEELKENHYYPDAYETLVRASKILPDNPIPHHMVAILFQDLGKKDQAEEFLKKSLGLHPTPESYSQLAALYEKSNALNDAWATANTGLQLFPDDAYLQLTLARCERRAKKFGQALKRLLGLEGKTSDRIIKTQMHFLIGLLYDQQDEIDSAFSYYAKAKKEAAANLDKSTADKEISLQYIRDMSQLDLSKLPRAKPPARPGGPAGVAFLVGFPRSGTTLLNQILDSHPQLVGLEEKPTIPGPAALLMQMAAGYPKALEGLSEDMAEKLREAYYQRIESFTDFEADSIVIDKLPLN
ncbi:MAG: tetratricopeptide repeat protein, partial [Proteobacteria bacterium]|nr:tetratricopeptide repeat protein [Pseudomonadota bacterium]